jgi:carbon-monoxide dehydrogenase iron sulfur subunit
MRKALVLDIERCSGCRTCEGVCSLFHEREINPEKSRIRVIRSEEDAAFMVAVCPQCDTPICLEVCPTKAISKDESTGVVAVNHEACVGCKLCVYVCPIGGMSFYTDMRAFKCDLCSGDPQCVKNCPRNAIEFIECDKIGMAKKRAGILKTSNMMRLIMEKIRE